MCGPGLGPSLEERLAPPRPPWPRPHPTQHRPSPRPYHARHALATPTSRPDLATPLAPPTALPGPRPTFFSKSGSLKLRLFPKPNSLHRWTLFGARPRWPGPCSWRPCRCPHLAARGRFCCSVPLREGGGAAARRRERAPVDREPAHPRVPCSVPAAGRAPPTPSVRPVLRVFGDSTAYFHVGRRSFLLLVRLGPRACKRGAPLFHSGVLLLVHW